MSNNSGNKKNITAQVVNLLEIASRECVRYESKYLYPQHCLLALIDSDNGIACTLLKKVASNLYDLRKKIIINIDGLEKIKYSKKNKRIEYSTELSAVMKMATSISDELDASSISSEHLLMAMTVVDSYAKDLLLEFGIHKSRLQFVLEEIVFNSNTEESTILTEDNKNTEISPKKQINKKSKTNLLEVFGTDLNMLARAGKITPVIGREVEINRIIRILSRLNKNNPILLGDSGVGKSAIVDGIAYKIIRGDVPQQLKNKRIILFDLGALVAGTKYRGQFEERLKSIINEVESNPEIVLVLDEIHTLVSAGSAEGSLDAANMLKDPLSRGTFQCIGLTTWSEYKKYIEPDSALSRRFNIVNIDPTDTKQTFEILKGIATKYENYHGVVFSDEILDYVVKLSDKYVKYRQFPDKAIDVMDELGARKKLEITKDNSHIAELEKEIQEKKQIIENLKKEDKFDKCVGEQKKLEDLISKLNKYEALLANNVDKEKRTIIYSDVSQTVSDMVGIPINRNEDNIASLKSIGNELKARIKGQDKAVESVCKAVLRGRTGLKSPNKPIATLLFAGKTGVGKTETARCLAEIMFGDKDALIREDMGHYSEKHSVSQMVGCFLPDQNVLVREKGLIPIQKISVGDYVLTHNNQYKKVIKVHEYDYNGKIRELFWSSTKTEPLKSICSCTENHEFFVKRYDPKTKKFELQWVKANELKKYNVGTDEGYDLLLIPDNWKDEVIEKKALTEVYTALKIIGAALNVVKIGYEIYKLFRGKKDNDPSRYYECFINYNSEKDYNGKVYDLSVADDESYTIQGVAVHNSPPGYVGYEEGGGLTNKIRRKPYSVVLLDEAEKADRGVWSLLLPMLEEGRLVDNKTNVPIDCKNTIVILTTNLGNSNSDNDKTVGNIGFGVQQVSDNYETLKQKTMKSVEKVLPPEFLNRIDEIVVFNELSKDSIYDIIHLMIDEYNKNIKDLHGFTIRFTDSLKQYLVGKGYSEKYGARELRRVIDNVVLDKLVEYYIEIDGKVDRGVVVECDVDEKNEMIFRLV